MARCQRTLILYKLKDKPEPFRLIELGSYSAGVHCLLRTYGTRLEWYGRIKEDPPHGRQ